jgi:uncharacterized protein YndB with AHSA1/START domain
MIAAPPGQLYRAFMDPCALVLWLPPKGMAGELIAFDPQLGGHFEMRLTYGLAHAGPPGKTTEDSDVVRGTFVEIASDERIQFRSEFDSTDPSLAGVMTMTWTFEAVGDGTKVTIRCDDVPEGIRVEDHQAGLNSSLENLAAFATQ